MTTDALPLRTQKIHITKEEEARYKERRDRVHARIESVMSRLHPPSASLGQAVPTPDPQACPDADVLARTLIASGLFDEEALKKRIGAGVSDAEHYFACHFATSLAAYAADTIAQEGVQMWETVKDSFTQISIDNEHVFDKTVARFAEGALSLPQDVYAYALDTFAKHLVLKNESFSVAFYQRSFLRTSVKSRIAKILSLDKNIHQPELRQLTLDVLPNVTWVERSPALEQECAPPRHKSSPS